MAEFDLLAFGSHPDDVELAIGGLISKMTAQGKKVGIVDLTRGELGTRGTPETRAEEAAEAGRILGIQARENLGLEDGFVRNDKASQLKVIEVIRKYRPKLVIAPAITDRHPDHGSGSKLVRDSAFLAGLRNIPTSSDGKMQAHFRPEKVFFYVQDQFMIPDFVVDVTGFFDKKLEAIKAYKSQFFDPESKEPQTYISSEDYIHYIVARSREFGHFVGVSHGEGLISERPVKIDDVLSIL